MQEKIVMPTESYAFPQQRVEQIEATKEANQPYRSPHLQAKLAAQGGLKRGDEQQQQALLEIPVAEAPTVGAVARPQNHQRQHAAARTAEPVRRPSAMNMQSNLVPASVTQVASAVRDAYPETVDLPMVGEPIFAPGAPPPASDHEAIVLSLPSNYVFYSFKDVYATVFKGRNLAKLSRAATEKSTLHLVEAISSVLSSSSGTPNLAFELTMPDFYYVLYWLRLNSFTRISYVHQYSCDSELHIQMISEQKAELSSLRQAVTIKKADLLVRKLDIMVDVPDLQYPDVYLWPCTMREAVEIAEDQRVIEDQDFAWAAGLGIYLRRLDNTTMSLDERVTIVNDMSPDDIHALTEYDKIMTSYGIEETVTVQCATCGCKRRSAIELQAQDFFP